MTAERALWFLLAHVAGDYVIQSHWMAVEKTKRWWPALLHGATYGLPFIPLVPSVWAWLVITGTHAVIDRYRLARYVVWLRNLAAPRVYRAVLSESPTGSPRDVPVWLATWLLIIVDNGIHVTINLLAITFL